MKMENQKYDYGMIGLGTMGRNLVFNMNDHGYSVVGFDKKKEQVATLTKEAGDKKVSATLHLDEFVKSLKVPRVIMMLVPAGKVVDEVIAELKPFLAENDLLIDCGNSHFTDTNKRNEELAKSTIHFMGVGISGGELGARYGPSIMPGGPKNVYERVAKMLEAVSAKVKEEPCVTWLGPGSAGHYVKMVHNGIEYGLMQLISESYHLLKVAGGMTNEDLHAVFSKWNEGILQSYLIEITADIFIQKDDLTSTLLIDRILDTAKQNGTGAWTSEDAMHLKVPIPVIDIAVSMRDLSAYKKDRETAQQKMDGPEMKFNGDKNELVMHMEQALYFSMITAYAQGMALLQVASKEYTYDLNLEKIAAIWRGGCIIRASLLEDIRTVFSQQPGLSNLLLSNTFSKKLMQFQRGIRNVIQTAVETGIPLPAMMSALAYFDSYNSAWLPANLIQAQRDDFGAHTYERNDREGNFHTHWNQTK
jgi:6-phosphogluconate dehydrogenase